MNAGFYERLQVPLNATPDQIREGYQYALGELVRRLRRARASGADTAALEAERDEIQEAFEVLSSPRRRRIYNSYRALSPKDLPGDCEGFWDLIQGSAADPAAAAAVELIRGLSTLKLGASPRPATPASKAAPPTARAPSGPAVQMPRSMSMLSPAERAAQPIPRLPEAERARHAQAVAPPPSVAPPPAAHRVTISPETPTATPQLSPIQIAFPTPPEAKTDPGNLDIRRLADLYGYDGKYLAAVRRARGLKIEDVFEETKIATRFIEAIETNDFARLPAEVFMRGYITEIASFLDLDVDAVVDGYMTLYSRDRGG